MSADEHVVDIAETQVLVYRDGDDWFWRGADWTGHMGSIGAFPTRERAIENAKTTLVPGPDGGLSRRPG